MKNKQPTNKQVMQAIDDCIYNRWSLMARGIYTNRECALCELSEEHWTRTSRNVELSQCPGCPIYEYDARLQCERDGSPYQQWRRSGRIADAKKMLATLRKIRRYFFGEKK